MARVPGLVRKKSAYYYVRRIPETIRTMFGNKTQLTIPLNTSDFRIGTSRAKSKAVEIDAQFQAARVGVKPSASLKPSKVSLSQLESAAKLYVHECERSSRGILPDEANADDARMALMHLENPQDDWGGSIEALAQRLAKKYELALGPGDAYWGEFIELVHRAETEVQNRRLDRAIQRHSARTHDRFFGEVYDGAPAPNVRASAGIALADVIERFEQDPHRARLTESAGKKYVIPLAVLREVVGDEINIGAITRAQCADVVDLIAHLPSNYTKYLEFKGKSFREIGLNPSGRRLLSPGTVEVYAHHLSAFFNFAVQKGVRETNPATRLTPKGGEASSGKPPFTLDELNRLVELLPDWSSGDRGGRFWLPLIGLFSGMRIGEIIWLTQEDVQTIDGVTAFSLRPRQERSLKTKGAARVIPLHPTLIELGFLSLVDPKLPKETRLFADLSGKSQKQAVDHFQKRFSYWLKAYVGVRPGVSFHSFRHNFRDATREAELSIDAVRAIGGWGRGSSIEERYGQGARPSKLSEWLGKVNYPGLKLQTLMPV